MTCSLPGGSAEPNTSLIDQAIIETEEEAEVTVSDAVFTGVVIKNSYYKKPEWIERLLKPAGYDYDGFMTYLFIAKFKDKLPHGLGDNFWDHEAALKYNFYDPEELGLSETYLNAIRLYMLESVV